MKKMKLFYIIWFFKDTVITRTERMKLDTNYAEKVMVEIKMDNIVNIIGQNEIWDKSVCTNDVISTLKTLSLQIFINFIYDITKNEKEIKNQQNGNYFKELFIHLDTNN